MKKYRPGDGKWAGIYYHDAKDHKRTWYAKIGNDRKRIPGENLTPTQALRYRSKLINRETIDKVVKPKKGLPGLTTFDKAYATWKEHNTLKWSTRKSMISRWNRYLKKSLTGVNMDTWTEANCRALIAKWQKLNGLAPGTIKRLTSMISALYNAVNIKSPIYGMAIEGSKVKRERILTLEEVDALVIEFKKFRWQYFLIAGLAAYGGMRPVEIQFLRLADIKDDHILVRDVKTPTGKQKSRKIYIEPDSRLEWIVDEIRALPVHDLDRIFPKYLDYPFIDTVIDRLGYNDGVAKGDRVNRVTLYTLRHSFASNMLEAGASMLEVQAAMGHDRPETTLNYLHPEDDAAREGMRKLSNRQQDNPKQKTLRRIK